MPKTGGPNNLDEYAPVAERIALFYRRFPLGRIVTRLVEYSDDVVIVQASIFRSAADRRPSATGWAAERPGDGEINTVACLENTETSAIGRALANLGFAGARPALGSGSTDEAAAVLESLGVRTIYGHPPFRPAQARTRTTSRLPYEPPGNASGSRRSPSPIVLDLIRLLDDAERYGMRPRRAAEYKRRIEMDYCPEVQLERLERALRHWVNAARERHAMETRHDRNATI